MSERAGYLRDGAAIYERSFAIIRSEADLSRFSAEEAEVAVRMIHACGVVELAPHIVFGPSLVAAVRAALAKGAPIFCDAEMLACGITRGRLPARNDVICTLNDPRVPALAAKLGTTINPWRTHMESAMLRLTFGSRARKPLSRLRLAAFTSAWLSDLRPSVAAIACWVAPVAPL